MTPTILSFDTSGPYCEASVLHHGKQVTRHVDLARGQAERLIGLVEEVLSEARCKWSDLEAIGVGTGPGNFTGIRISVSAARGLALGLSIPAVGVSQLEAFALGQGPVIACVSAPRGMVYAQSFNGQATSEANVYAWQEGAFPDCSSAARPVVVGQDADAIAEKYGLSARHVKGPLTIAIAKIVQTEMRNPTLPAPAPLYIRPANAAPSRDAPPAILDA